MNPTPYKITDNKLTDYEVHNNLGVTLKDLERLSVGFVPGDPNNHPVGYFIGKDRNSICYEM
jgi:hypothetical protein